MTKLRALLRLGVSNLWRVGLYRVLLKTGLHPVQRISALPVRGIFFDVPPKRETLKPRSDWQPNHMTYFGRDVPIANPPDWFSRPESATRAPHEKAWWQIQDFNPSVGDIKTVWEASRFDWVLPFAQRAVSGDADSLAQLNVWIADWSAKNPPYLGANWKCGQEASIRVMHLACAALAMNANGLPPLTDPLRGLLRQHLKRIAPTMSYAIGQANNHGTSEAAALFIGGLWLGGKDGNAWSKSGRKWLENRARVLIMPDGTFSQYSVTYHRVMLDTFALAEIWRRRCDSPVFSTATVKKLKAATAWLDQMTHLDSGDAPVIGANDGSHLIRFTDADYRDFRPSVQLAMAIFCQKRRYCDGPQDKQLAWLGISLPQTYAPKLESKSFPEGGFHILRTANAVTYFRIPQFRFRPSQADALHCDLWIEGRNVLRDAGSFSYNVSEADTSYFNGTASHNTIQFDGRDQMPRVSRFLFGDWLKARDLEIGSNMIQAGYTDQKGASHTRQLTMCDDTLEVRDDIMGFETATLRWRLAPGHWSLDRNKLVGQGIAISIEGSDDIALKQGEESRYYLQKSPVPVLEVTAESAGTIKTSIRW